MLPCTLHVGAHKTGSTSIQDALFLHLRDPRYQYNAGGEPNGSLVMTALFSGMSGDEYSRWLGQPIRRFPAFRDRLRRRFERGLRRARRRQAHLIVSAESLWLQPEPVLRAVRGSLNDHGFEVQVRAYVRPWRSWLTSWCLHRIRAGQLRFHPEVPLTAPPLMIRPCCERLWKVFGRDRVHITRLDRDRFPGRCVVQDFCHQIGFAIDPGYRIRSNERLSLPALQLLYSHAWFRDRPDPRSGTPSRGLHRLIERMRHLPGPPPRIHPGALATWLAPYRSLDPWVQRELGFSLEEPDRTPEDPAGLRTEADLLAYTPESLEWLAAQTAQPVIRHRDGPAAARAVAAQVERLGERPPSLQERCDSVTLRLQKNLIRLRDGC